MSEVSFPLEVFSSFFLSAFPDRGLENEASVCCFRIVNGCTCNEFLLVAWINKYPV